MLALVSGLVVARTKDCFDLDKICGALTVQTTEDLSAGFTEWSPFAMGVGATAAEATITVPFPEGPARFVKVVVK